MKKIILLMLAILLVSKISYATSSKDNKVFLVWERIPNAVMYELIIKKKYYKDVFLTQETKITYVPGTELEYYGENLYYQVRALDVNKLPMTKFSSELPIDSNNTKTKIVTLGDYDNVPNSKLYQVFTWVPVNNANYYVLRVAKLQNGQYSLVREYKISGKAVFDYYDKKPYIDTGKYVWSVVAYDQNEKMITESSSQSFTVDRNETVIASLGDSITHGGGAISNPPSYPEYNWQSYTNYKIRNLGYSGNTVDDLVNRFNNDVLPFRPKTLIILAGINDLRQGRDSNYVIKGLNLLKNKCIINNIKPIFVSVTPLNPEKMIKVLGSRPDAYWRQEQDKVNSWIQQQEYNINVHDMMINNEGLLKEDLSVDGLHPDIEGKKIIGTIINEYIDKMKISTI